MTVANQGRILHRSNKHYKVLDSKWMRLTRSETFLRQPAVAKVANYPQRAAEKFPLWTDPYNNLYQILTVLGAGVAACCRLPVSREEVTTHALPGHQNGDTIRVL